MPSFNPKMMIDEWSGFTVYDAETGEPIDGTFVFDADGYLFEVYDDDELYEAEKEGKYIIQFADTGKFLRW